MNYIEIALLFLFIVTILMGVYFIGRFLGLTQVEKMCNLIYKKVK